MHATRHPSHDVSSQAFPDLKTHTITRNGEGLGTEARREGMGGLLPR